ncbi:MAG TPA: TlpA disulfide reductase family protein [Polyangiaceae bacterium]|nr:TlpA disulfide reductase family protein [Polyangiaceae bacterium]
MKAFVVSSWVRYAAGAALTLCLLACGAGGGSGLGAPGAKTAADAEHPLLGAAAPEFELESPNGKQKVSLSAQAGKVVVVDFWATWCAPCKESFPAYQRLAQKFGKQLTVIGVSVDEDPAGIPEFAKETGAKFPLAWDDGQSTSKSYRPPTMPTSFVIDRSGIVRFVHSGFHAGDERAIESEIASLLK